MEFFFALILGLGISLLRNYKSRGYQTALAQGRYIDFTAGLVVEALPYVAIAWLILTIL
jgi:hypothetical protein